MHSKVEFMLDDVKACAVKMEAAAIRPDADGLIDLPYEYAEPTLTELSSIDPPSFHDELTQLINRYSKESGSDTPDFILATYLRQVLAAFDVAVSDREVWYELGRPTGGAGDAPNPTG
jgi:hypothetical protein